MAGVILDALGNLYGATSAAGTAGGRALFELSPGSGGLTQQRLSQLYALLGCYEKAVEAESRSRLLAGEAPHEVLAKADRLRRALASGGGSAYWKEQLQLLKDSPNPPESYVRPYGLAIVYTHLNEKDAAFENLEIAYDERDPQMTELAVEPHFDALRADVRFGRLTRRIGLTSS